MYLYLYIADCLFFRLYIGLFVFFVFLCYGDPRFFRFTVLDT